MKTFLSLERAAALCDLSAEQLKILCQAGKLDAKQTGDDWFIAEEELVETLGVMNRDVILAEIADLQKVNRHEAQVVGTDGRVNHLARATSGVLVVLCLALGVAALQLHLRSPEGQQLATLTQRQVAGVIMSDWKARAETVFADLGTTMLANLRALDWRR